MFTRYERDDVETTLSTFIQHTFNVISTNFRCKNEPTYRVAIIWRF